MIWYILGYFPFKLIIDFYIDFYNLPLSPLLFFPLLSGSCLSFNTIFIFCFSLLSLSLIFSFYDQFSILFLSLQIISILQGSKPTPRWPFKLKQISVVFVLDREIIIVLILVDFCWFFLGPIWGIVFLSFFGSLIFEFVLFLVIFFLSLDQFFIIFRFLLTKGVQKCKKIYLILKKIH